MKRNFAFRSKYVLIVIIAFLSINLSAQKKKKYKLPDIDLSHWSVTTPELNAKGGAMNIQPPAILNYAKDERLIC